MSDRIGEHPVLLRHEDGELRGVEFWPYPVDFPPLIEAGGQRLYRHVWIERGWTVHEHAENDAAAGYFATARRLFGNDERFMRAVDAAEADYRRRASDDAEETK